MKSFISLLTIAGLAANALAGPILRVANTGAPNTIADKYIVVLKSDISEADVEAHTSRISSYHSNVARDLSGPKAHGVQRKFKFSSTGFKGYSGGFDQATLQEILKSPEVAFVEQDAVVTLSTEQTGSTWGLDRISHQQFSSPYTYQYNGNSAGNGVTVFVIDTGVRVTHQEFRETNGTSRATFGYNAVDSSNTDGNGHGSHCAGTIAGKTYGVAKKARIVAVKVLNASGSGSNSGVIAGMNYVARTGVPNFSVASMSLGGGYSAATNNAAKALVAAGVTLVVAAGNESQDAGNVSPASTPEAITVGAIGSGNTLASFTNYGTFVDIFAPGVSVLSSWATSDSATNTISGTSMACPHVAGLAAYFLSELGKTSPSSLTAHIKSVGITGQITGSLKSSVNLIAYNNYA